MDELAALVKTVVAAQAEQIRTLSEDMRSLMKIVGEQSDSKPGTSVTASHNGTVEQCRALEALSNMIEPFVYDEESGLTFEAWYNRFRGVIAVGAANFTDTARVELILMRLETSANALYRQSIAPSDPSEISFDDTIKRLTELFKKKVSLLRTRWNCLNLQRRNGEDFAAYGARVNQATVDFKLRELTDEQFKVLIFILGLQDNTERSIRTGLLNMHDKANSKDLTLQMLITEAERVVQIQRDCGIGGQGDSVHLVHAPPQKQKHSQSPHRSRNKKSSTSSSSSVPRTPCWQCGALHFVRDCTYADHTCSRCRVVGHKEGYCAALGNNRKNGNGSHHVKVIQVGCSQSADHRERKRLFVDVMINNIKLTLQFDTGSDVTVISEESWRSIGSPPLSTTDCRPVDCQGNQLTVFGEVRLSPQLNGKTITERCIVAKCNSDLFGLEWINKFGLRGQPLSTFCNKITAQDKKDWSPGVFVPQLNDRAPIGKSPVELTYEQRIRLPTAAALPPATPPTLARDTRMGDQLNLIHDAKQQRDFIEGDEVLVKTKRKSKWSNGQVIEKVGTVMYNIIIQGRVIRAHANRIRRTGPPTQPLEDQVDDYLYDDPVAPATTSSPPPTEAPVTRTTTRPNWRAVTRTSPPNLRPRRR